MAGSYRHINRGMSFVENMGDAHETIEELLYLVRVLAHDLVAESGTGDPDDVIVGLLENFYAMERGEKATDEHMRYVKERMAR